jgi:transposase-like protein
MTEQVELIKSEIAKIPMNSQGRRIYSKAIKASVRKLKDEGMSLSAIAEGTGIHVTTLHYWFPQPKKVGRGFKELRVVPIVEKAAAVEIHFESGVRILGLRIADLAQLLKQELVR